ncbi:MAG: cytochrome c maturation protein CcmE [Chloroflexi bacterium]|nr:cytochrome c maturation protein CcmE [Chloroflexota bacterium]
MSRKRAIGTVVPIIIVVSIIIGFKLFTSPGAPGGIPEHITIAQATGDKAGQEVKVGGDVVPGSVSWDNASGSLRFTLTGEGNRMAVVYPGLAPNDFKPGLPLVVEGTYANNGVFQATSLTTRSSPLCKACHQ